MCLPPPGHVPNSQECFASGWGKNQFGKQGIYSVIMKKVPLPIVPFQQCQTALQQTRLTNKFQLHSSFICAGGIAGADTCQVRLFIFQISLKKNLFIYAYTVCYNDS